MSDDTDLGVLAESFAQLLHEEWPRERAVAFPATNRAFEAELWAMISGLGWPALTVPEAAGGLGLDLAAAMHLHRALGAAAAPLPMLGTTLAAELIAAGPAQQAAWLPAIADGSARIAFAEPTATPLAADGDTLSGTFADLLDAPSATLLLLRAVRSGRSGWLVVPADAAGVTVEPHPLADTTRTLGTVSLAGVAIGDDRFIAATPAIDDRVMRAAGIALAADAIGGGEAVLAATVAYMKVREQFGVVIGSFQALKHRVADHQTALVAARHLVEYAAALPGDDPQALLLALSAKQHATRCSAQIARDCIQLHGGVGFTAEFVPHLYLKRGKANEALFGTRAQTLDRVAELLERA